MDIKQESIVGTAIKLLTFRISRDGLLRLNRTHFLFGLVCTWVVGMGRYWDDLGAKLLQHLGVGSVIYIFVLSLIMWLLIWPLRPKAWSYFSVLTFVSLTSPPAALYAIPVERFFNLETARSLNVWFLAVVAAWRVALLMFFLRRYAGLGFFQMIIAPLLPLTLIVTALTALNLERAVFNIMGGLREESGTANDTAYAVLFAITYLSWLLIIPLLLSYVGLIVYGFVQRREMKVAVKEEV